MHQNKLLKAQLRTVLAKAFKTADKNKKFVFQVASSLAQGGEVLNDPEMYLAGYLLKQFEELKAMQTSADIAMTLIQSFLSALQVDISGKIRKQFQECVKQCFSFKSHSTEVQNLINVWHQNTKSYDCLCGHLQNQKALWRKKTEELCYNCGHKIHSSCFWQKQKSQVYFECPVCYLSNCLPHKPIKQILFLAYIKQPKGKADFKGKFYVDLKRQTYSNIDIRCVRLTKKCRYELTFPQNCSIFLSTRKVAQFQPLSATSPLKRRPDEQLVLSKSCLSYLNTFSIQQRRNYIQNLNSNGPEHHLFMIVSTTSRTILQLESQFLNNRLPIEECQSMINQYLNGGNHECEIDRLNVSLKCPFYQTPICFPVRSRHCISHYQPFDLMNFITASVNSKNSTQKWKCPICKKRAYDLVVDDYIAGLIKGRNVKEITFRREGEPLIVERQVSERDDDEEDSQTTANHKQQDTIDVQSIFEQSNIVGESRLADVIQISDNEQPLFEQTRKRTYADLHANDIDQGTEQENGRGRKIMKEQSGMPLQLSDKIQQTTIHHTNPTESSASPEVFLKLKENIKEMVRQKLKNIAQKQQKEKLMVRRQEYEVVQMKNKQMSLQQQLQRQKELLRQANAVLKSVGRGGRVSGSQQLIFNKICSKMMNFRLDS